MSYSLGEYEDLCKKAARGSGMHWGQAEEVGKAARGLSTYGLDDGRLIVTAIKSFNEENALWLGPALCDAGADFKYTVNLPGVVSPALMLPFLQMMLGDKDISLKIDWIGFEGILSSSEFFCLRSEGFTEVGPANIRIKSIEKFVAVNANRCSRVNVDEKALIQLNAFAYKTYAPSTHESRMAGAGAGLNDND